MRMGQPERAADFAQHKEPVVGFERKDPMCVLAMQFSTLIKDNVQALDEETGRADKHSCYAHPQKVDATRLLVVLYGEKYDNGCDADRRRSPGDVGQATY